MVVEGGAYLVVVKGEGAYLVVVEGGAYLVVAERDGAY